MGSILPFAFNGIEVVNVDGSGTPCLKGFSLGIGQAPEGYLYPFNGTIDEVAIWNKSLSASEIQDLYQLQIGTYYWYVNATDGTYTTQSETRQFTIENPDSTPTATVTNLAEQSQEVNWIYWNWTNPGDADFSQAIVYINGTNEANTSNNYYNSTG